MLLVVVPRRSPGRPGAWAKIGQLTLENDFWRSRSPRRVAEPLIDRNHKLSITARRSFWA